MNQRLTIFFSIALGLILMGIWLYIVDLSEMIAIIKKVKVAGFLPLAIMFALVYFVRSVRWKVILSPIQKISFSEAFNLCMTNYFVNFLIPIHAGEVARVRSSVYYVILGGVALVLALVEVIVLGDDDPPFLSYL